MREKIYPVLLQILEKEDNREKPQAWNRESLTALELKKKSASPVSHRGKKKGKKVQSLKHHWL